MGNSQNTNDELEEARDQVKSEEIVVHGAKLSCSFAANSQKPNYLNVMDEHGVMQDGNICAHDGSCIPLKNIAPFSGCTSGFAKSVLTALSKNATGDTKKNYDAALKIISLNNIGRSYRTVPCTLPLLDRWFDADETEIVTDSMAMGERIRQMVEDVKKKLKASLSSGATDAIYKAAQGLYGNLSVKEEGEYKEKNKALEKLKGDIDKKSREILKDLNTKVQIQGNDFSEIAEQLRAARDGIEEIRQIWQNAYQIYNEIKDYETYYDELAKYYDEIDGIITKIEEWKEDEYHLITTNSFLVCRCGGIITFLDSGQSFGDMVETLKASMYTLVTEFREHCQEGMTRFSNKDNDENDFKWSSYKMAAEGLGYFERMLLGDNSESDSTEACIYLELICHSYNDEVNKAFMAALSLISLKVNALAFLLACYTISTIEEDAQGVNDGVSGDISAVEAVADQEGGVITKLGGGALVQFNNLYTIASSIVNLFYVSYDTWIETIRITVFTDSHAHICERGLKRSGELMGKSFIQMPTEKEYSGGDLGRGLEWKEEPGVYIKKLMHKGDNLKDDSAEMENTKNLQGFFPVS